MRAVLLGLLLAGAAFGAAPPAILMPDQMKLLRERNARWNAALLAWRAGKQVEAIEALEAALKIDLRLLGPWHRTIDGTANVLATAHRARGEWLKEAASLAVVLEARRRLDGEDHWKTTDARLALAEAKAQAKHTPAQREALQRAASLNREGIAAFRKGDPARALSIFRRSLTLIKETLGEGHPDYARALNNLAMLYQTTGDYKSALPLYEQALLITKRVQGERHPAYALGLHNLAHLHWTTGDYRKALPLYETALAIRRRLLGEEHPDYAITLNNLAALLDTMGDYKRALALYRQAVDVTRRARGENHPDHAATLCNLASLYQAIGEPRFALSLYKKAHQIERRWGRLHPDHATTLNNLARLYTELGDYKQALSLYEKVRQVRKEALGEKHPDYATTLNDLAALYDEMGDFKQAAFLYGRALSIRKEALGEKHPHYAQSLLNLAQLYGETGEHKLALPLAQKALAVYKESVGERHPDYARALNNLGVCYHDMADLKAALPLYVKALEARRRALGEDHPDYAQSLNNLASLRLDIGDDGAALSLLRQAAHVSRRKYGAEALDHARYLNNMAAAYHQRGRPGAALLLQEQALSSTRSRLLLAASIQSERQQLAAYQAFRAQLDNRLSMPDESAHFSHNHVLAWKGATFAAQQARRRLLLAGAGPDTRALVLKLQDATRALALLSSRADTGSQKGAEKAAREKERLEARLSELSEPYRLALSPPRSEEFRAQLPRGVVLVDFLVHTGLRPDRPLALQKRARRLNAWAVRADAPTARIDLGPMAPIEEAITSWRRALEEGRDAAATPARLREAIWAPLEKHLVGAKIVLISPDGSLGRLPFAALPGKKKGTYLIQEVPLAVLPVPQVLPQLLQPVKGGPSALTVCAVEYGDTGPWVALPGTGPEGDAVAALARRLKADVTSLKGAKATAAALREALPRHRYVHLATHGFFAPPSMKSALEVDVKETPRGLFGREGVHGWDPLLLSGLVLARANSPTAEDDGILRASEVAEMGLSGLELAVLSACQTGLGKEAAGEGMLGLQRAFAVAGCKSVVSSLWSVHDAATAVLMERFYLHLWQKKLSKLEALRQAQLDVLHHPEWVEERARKFRGIKGLRGVGKASEEIVAGKKQRLSPPAWWAAWQLSGDWR
jgi:tetratricopeptide (TPR) repeat protein